ncbi:MAG: hypothetical protein IPH82_10670 [Chloroflexi bacterium]|nr:hypothetical protein [Chloroflexota bacterium]
MAKDNLGTYPSLFAAAALLLDYILTVSVSVSAGCGLLRRLFRGRDYRVLMAITASFHPHLDQPRGVRESGTIFALPTYAFVGGVLLVVGIGLVRFTGLFGAPDLVPRFIMWRLFSPYLGYCLSG